MATTKVSRRQFLGGMAAAAAAYSAFSIVPRNVLGGQGYTPPSDTFGGALVGCGDRGPSTFQRLGGNVRKICDCDVRWVGQADNKTKYTDFRRVMERKDVDLVAIATPPHWHALIAIAAMEAGKDVLGEKPMTRTIADGRAVANAEKRYKRIYQVGVDYRVGDSRNKANMLTHKISRSGLLKNSPGVHICRGGLKVRAWTGHVNAKEEAIPANLDWDMYCGPSPLRPYNSHRFGGSHRGYWDYEGGGLGDMGQHHFDSVNWNWGKDDTSPVEIETYAPPAHPTCVGMWGWSELKYADGTTFVITSEEWGQPYNRLQERNFLQLSDLDEASRRIVESTPDPEPLLTFEQAIRQRKPAAGNAEAAHRTACIMHLTNISIRVGRKLKYDPVKEVFIGDEEANRLANPPLRAPWHL
jgi:myo-inositol 2-dehydrogenase / D-chiro-inositol 1-dehydrogenase